MHITNCTGAELTINVRTDQQLIDRLTDENLQAKELERGLRRALQDSEITTQRLDSEIARLRTLLRDLAEEASKTPAEASHHDMAVCLGIVKGRLSYHGFKPPAVIEKPKAKDEEDFGELPF